MVTRACQAIARVLAWPIWTDRLRLLQYFGAAAFLIVAAVAYGAIITLILIGLTGLDLKFFAVLAVAAIFATGVGVLLLPPRRPEQTAALPRRVPSSEEQFEKLLDGHYRDLLNEVLEQNLAAPAYRRPGEHRIRPAWPPGPPESET